ncbi:hypothetical protein BGW80DRAFT_1501190 [Lactifluus volemus]|nr:hypothetical protein BGW80DRAFT_1501190 [Lactifluus volemus]
MSHTLFSGSSVVHSQVRRVPQPVLALKAGNSAYYHIYTSGACNLNAEFVERGRLSKTRSERARNSGQVGTKGEGKPSHERKGGQEYNPRGRVHPQNTSRDVRGLFERSIGCQPRMWARREARSPRRNEGKLSTKEKRCQTERTMGDARRTSTKNGRQTRERTQNLKGNEEKGRGNVVRHEAAENGSKAEA